MIATSLRHALVYGALILLCQLPPADLPAGEVPPLTAAAIGEKQQPEPTHDALSLRTAEDLALDYAPLLRRAREGHEIYRGQRLQAYGEVLPTLDGSVGLSRSHEEGSEASSQCSRTVALSQPLFKGGKIQAEIRRAGILQDVVREDIRLTRHAVLRQVRLAYFDVLLARKLLTVSQTQERLAKEFLDNTKTRVARELASETEVPRAEVELARQNASRTRAETHLGVFRTRLLIALGLPTQTDLRLSDDLAGEVSAAPAHSILVRKAMAMRPELRQARLEQSRQEWQIRSVRSQLFPQVLLQGRYSDNRSTGNDWHQDWQVGLALRVPFFDGLQTRGRVREERARLNQLRLTIQHVEDTVREEIRVALLELNAAQRLVQSLRRSVQTANQYLENERQRQRLGTNTYFDVLNARQSLAATESNYYQALRDLSAARTELDWACGTIDRRESE